MAKEPSGKRGRSGVVRRIFYYGEEKIIIKKKVLQFIADTCQRNVKLLNKNKTFVFQKSSKSDFFFGS